MSAEQIRPGLHRIRLPGVNAFLLDAGSDGLVLVDSGVPGSAGQVVKCVASLDRDITEVQHIFVTHCHPDHAGGLAELRRWTSARVYMHRRDAMLLAKGMAMRRLVPSPGLLNALLFRLIVPPKPTTVPPTKADVLVRDGDTIPVAGGISVIHTPGHTEGHVVFLARKRGILFVGDAAANLLGLRLMPAYEHVRQGVMSLHHLCRFEFEVACFGHGPAIRRGAAERFRARWGQRRSTWRSRTLG